MGGRVCLSVCALLTLASAAPDPPAPWIRSQPQQTLHGLMISVEEQLRMLDFRRWESTLKQLGQRMDSLESSFRRLDSSLFDRLDKLERNLNSKELKDELTVEKLSHKVRDVLDSSYDRYNRRLGYTEDRLEMSLKKLQMGVESGLSRIEKMQEDVQTEVLEAVTILEDIKSQTSTAEVKLNSSHTAIQQHIQSLMTPNKEELQRISGSLDHLGKSLNNSLESWNGQSDSPLVSDVINIVRKEINTEANKFTNKLTNMYNELWRRSASVESLVKDLSRYGNSTHREIMEEVRSLVMSDRRDFLGDSQENFVEVAFDAFERKLQRKIQDLSRKIDDRMDNLSATQGLMIDTCFDGGICRSLESRLSQVLERIFDVVTNKIENYSNRTFDLDDRIVEMMELVKNQHSQLIRTVTHNTNMVMTLAKESSNTNKLLQGSISQLAEKTEYNFQEIHDEFQEISNTGGKLCSEGEKNNDDSTDLQKSSEADPRNETQVVIFTTSNPTQPEKKTVNKHYDKGVLKITSDDIKPLSDNTTTSTEELRNHQRVDSSLMRVVNLISPNLTRKQQDSLMKLLNKSIDLENLEAIIQNTEAEKGNLVAAESVLDYNIGSSNKTSVEDSDSSLFKTMSKLYTLAENSKEQDITEEISDFDYLEGSENVFTKNVINYTEASRLKSEYKETNVSDLSENFKEEIQAYILLKKIKANILNVSHLWDEMKHSFNHSDSVLTRTPLSTLQKLCFGERNVQNTSPDFLNDEMRKRLQLIHETVAGDLDFYEKIENICNTIIESLLTNTDQTFNELSRQ